AFGNRTMTTPPPMATKEMSGNAFGPNAYAAEMAEGAFHEGLSNASGYAAPGFVPPGYMGMDRSQALPVMPYGPAVQPGFYGPPPGQGIAPAGYPMQAYPTSQRSLMHQSSVGPIDPQTLLSQLRDAMLPSQREWAADRLAELDWK